MEVNGNLVIVLLTLEITEVKPRNSVRPLCEKFSLELIQMNLAIAELLHPQDERPMAKTN